MTSPTPGQDASLLKAARTARLEGRPQDAARSAAALVTANPAWAKAQTALGLAQMDLGLSGPAEMSFRAALSLEPSDAEAAYGLGITLLSCDRLTEALLWLRSAVAECPDNGAYRRGLGLAQMFGGDMRAAKESFLQALALDPSLIDALSNLVELTPMQGDGEDVSALWAKLDAARKTTSAHAQAQIAFARGKAHQDRAQHDQAFADFQAGAAMAGAGRPYDIEAAEHRLAAIERVFDKALLERLAGRGELSDRPIFVVGMPRCGSTLVEQILCSHPKIDGGGELAILPSLMENASGQGGERFPAWAPGMNDGDCRVLGEAYLSRLPSGIPGRTHITDKQLLNTAYVGAIHLILPRAKIIHVRRDPRDQVLSCFTAGLGNAGEHGYAYDLQTLGRYWRAHERLMSHWRAVLPPLVMFELPYEALVSQPEVWIRRMLDHCGLEWSEACLSPQSNKRPVRTASLSQIRQPINGRSIGRWRNYARHLEPAFRAMGLEEEAAVA